MRIKICGITNLSDALAAVKCGADALGFVFSKSPRRISPNAAKKIILELPPFVSKVGVFVNAGKPQVLKIIKECNLDTLQFHGEESDKYCAFFRKYCKIIKAIRIREDTTQKQLFRYRNVDAYLLDSYVKGLKGGTGRLIACNQLENIKFNKPLIVAGGIGIGNFKMLCRKFTPFALDVSSSIEIKPGKKDLTAMAKLITAVKLF